MKTGSSFLFAFIIVAFSFSGCKKYPDGPAISFKSKMKRMAQNWNIASWKINGQETMGAISSANSYFSAFCNTTYNYTTTVTKTTFINLSKNGNYTTTEKITLKDIDIATTNSNCVLAMLTTTQTVSGSGTWEFSDDKSQINIWNSTFDILELRKNKMKWKGTNSGITEELSFTR